jgi:hypothetical protein
MQKRKALILTASVMGTSQESKTRTIGDLDKETRDASSENSLHFFQ